MSHRADKFAVLNDGAAAHALHYAAGNRNKPFIGYFYKIIACFFVFVVFDYNDFKLFPQSAVNRGDYRRFAD